MNKIVPFALAASLLSLAAFMPQGSAGVLTGHHAAFAKARGARLLFTVQPIPGVPAEHTLLLGKPNLLRWTSPTQTIASDGKSLWVIDPAKKEYTETALAEGDPAKRLGNDITWVWSSFFAADPFKDVTGVQTGGRRTLKGVLVNEITFTTPAPKSLPVTAYVDVKTGLIRGFSMKSGGAETLVIATELELTEAPDAALAAFAPPAGMAKVEAAAVTGVPYAEISPILMAKCLPCHSAQMRSGGLDVTSYAALTRPGRRPNVVAGNSANSRLIQYMTGQLQPRMPQGGAPMPQEEIAKIASWIDAGAKE